jgi:preprotein translocase subunit SecA
MDYLRQGINLRAYAQSNPLNEYKRESFNMFSEMMHRIRVDTLQSISHFEMPDKDEMERFLRYMQAFSEEMAKAEALAKNGASADQNYLGGIMGNAGDGSGLGGLGGMGIGNDEYGDDLNDNGEDDDDDESDAPFSLEKIPCPCGSGKMFKDCCWK